MDKNKKQHDDDECAVQHDATMTPQRGETGMPGSGVWGSQQVSGYDMPFTMRGRMQQNNSLAGGHRMMPLPLSKTEMGGQRMIPLPPSLTTEKDAKVARELQNSLPPIHYAKKGMDNSVQEDHTTTSLDQSEQRNHRISEYCLDEPDPKEEARLEAEESQAAAGPHRPSRPPARPGAYTQGRSQRSFRLMRKINFSLVGLRGRSRDLSRGQSNASSIPEENYDEIENYQREHQERYRDNHQPDKDEGVNIKTMAILVAVVLVIIVAVVLGVVFNTGSEPSEEESAADPSPTSIGNPLLDMVFEDPASALPAQTIGSILNGGLKTAQNQAMKWLAADPNLGQYSIEQKRQRLALASFYYATNGPRWFSDGTISNQWLDYNLHECEWFANQEPCYDYDNLGVEHADYTSIVLNGDANGMASPTLQGTLVDELGMLTKLETLDLRSQKLKGTIPSELVRLSSSLQVLILQDCFFTGAIPEGLYAFLRGMWLSNNDRLDKGTIPSTVGGNTRLTHLSLVDAAREGTLPPELYQATNLQQIHLSRNKFSGSLPSEIGLLSSLTNLMINVNGFTGKIPSQIGLLNKLGIVLAGSNQIGGWLPTEMGLLESLRELEIVFNQVTGSIPSQLGSLPRLSHVDLGSNKLKGSLPTSLSQLSYLTNLELSYNQLEGSLHPDLFKSNDANAASWPRLVHLGLSDNRFTGVLPSEIGLLKSVQQVNLRSNNFESTLPSELSLLGSLGGIWLESTDLSGSVPQGVCSLPNLARITVDCGRLICPAACDCECL